MTTREAGKAGEHVATATLIEAVRTDGVEWEDHRGRVVMLAEDYDALVAACRAVLDEVIDGCKACGGYGRVPYYRIDGNEGGTMDAADCDECSNARALRERLIEGERDA